MPALDRIGYVPAVIVAGLLVAPGFALSAETAIDVQRQLRDVEQTLKSDRVRVRELDRKARQLATETAALRQALIAAAGEVRGSEEQAADLEADLATLEREKAERLARLATNRRYYVRVLDAMQRLVRRPPEALIVQPLSTEQMVRGAILLRAAVPEIQSRTHELRDELAALAKTRAAISNRAQTLGKVNDRMAGERQKLAALLDRKKNLSLKTERDRAATRKRTAALARSAKSLRDLVTKLRAEEERQQAAAEHARRAAADQARRVAADQMARERAEQEAAAQARLTALARPKSKMPIHKAKGKLWYPVVGKIKQRFGTGPQASLTKKGIVIETKARAQVIAPYDGTIAYAGAFRGYGQLLIIEHGHGYHSLIAGMGRIDGHVGQWIAGGEPVAVMGQPETGRPTLYVEMRRKGDPINPLPWLAQRKMKAKG